MLQISLIACLLWLSVTCSPTTNTTVQMRIINGAEVKKFQYPWMASLQANKHHFCGGTLLNPTTLLTASHCSYLSVYTLRVQVHRHNKDGSRLKERGFKFKVLNMFNVTNAIGAWTNDLAIWKIKQIGFSIGRLPVGMIELDDGNNPNQMDFKILGWGRDVVNATKPQQKLQVAPVLKIRNELCEKFYPFISVNETCTIGKVNQNGGPGDSGGPLFYEKPNGKIVLAGVISRSPIENPAFPGIYARIAPHLKWIQSHLQ